MFLTITITREWNSMCLSFPSLTSNGAHRVSSLKADVAPRLHFRAASFCMGASNDFDNWDQGISFFLPNQTWLQPPGCVDVLVQGRGCESGSGVRCALVLGACWKLVGLEEKRTFAWGCCRSMSRVVLNTPRKEWGLTRSTCN
jgi:hypothetical protein